MDLGAEGGVAREAGTGKMPLFERPLVGGHKQVLPHVVGGKELLDSSAEALALPLADARDVRVLRAPPLQHCPGNRHGPGLAPCGP